MNNNVASERVRVGLSQGQLAEQVGVDESTIRRWEQDISPAKAGTILRLSEIFHCTTDYLLARTDERTQKGGR